MILIQGWNRTNAQSFQEKRSNQLSYPNQGHYKTPHPREAD